MKIDDIFPHLNDRNPMMLCRVLFHKGDSEKLYRVPIEHRLLSKAGIFSKLRGALLPSSPSFDQLRCVLGTGRIGLFAPRLNPKQGDAITRQAGLGAIILFSSSEWWAEKTDLAKWQFNGLDATFGALPYKFKDIRVFARLNFSPDCWFVVLQGPMAGKVFRWSHDGDSQLTEPWAHDIREWGRRVWAEIPELFGGIIRFRGLHSIDEVSKDAELCPERFVSDNSAANRV